MTVLATTTAMQRCVCRACAQILRQQTNGKVMAAESRTSMADHSRGERAVWIWPKFTPMNDRSREIRCVAAKTLAQGRRFSASAIAA
jgi:hypothetical protein